MNTFLTVAIFLGHSLGTICLWKIRWRPERWKKSPRKIRASSSSHSISCNEYGRISEVCRLVFVISAANVILFFDSGISHWYSKLGRAARCDVYDPRDRSGGVTDIDHSNTTTAYILNIICKEVNRAGDVLSVSFVLFIFKSASELSELKILIWQSRQGPSLVSRKVKIWKKIFLS